MANEAVEVVRLPGVKVPLTDGVPGATWPPASAKIGGRLALLAVNVPLFCTVRLLVDSELVGRSTNWPELTVVGPV